MGWGGGCLSGGGGFGVDDGFDNVFGGYHGVGSSYDCGWGGWGNKYLLSLGVIASVMVLVIGRGVPDGCVGNRVGEGGFDV